MALETGISSDEVTRTLYGMGYPSDFVGRIFTFASTRTSEDEMITAPNIVGRINEVNISTSGTLLLCVSAEEFHDFPIVALEIKADGLCQTIHPISELHFVGLLMILHVPK